MKTSEHLVVGQVYTRAELAEQFQIVDATIRTGIFRPSGHDSIWLFITEEKSPAQTQYHDELVGDDLHMDGQTSGAQIIGLLVMRLMVWNYWCSAAAIGMSIQGRAFATRGRSST